MTTFLYFKDYLDRKKIVTTFEKKSPICNNRWRFCTIFKTSFIEGCKGILSTDHRARQISAFCHLAFQGICMVVLRLFANHSVIIFLRTEFLLDKLTR